MGCLQNCWGRDQGNHKTVDGQGLHEGQGQQPVEQKPSRELCPIRQFLARLDRICSNHAILASKSQDTAEVVCDLRTTSSQNASDLYTVDRSWYGNTGEIKSEMDQKPYEREPTPIPHTITSQRP